MIDLEKMARELADVAWDKRINQTDFIAALVPALRTVEREARREALIEMLAEYECLEERLGCCGEAMCDWRKSLEVMLEQSK